MGTKFGERLKELRVEKQIGQVELSNAVGVSKGIVSLWENGLREPKLSNLVAIAKYFKVTRLFGWIGRLIKKDA